MSDRIVEPVNLEAFALAKAAFLEKHPGGLPEVGTWKYRRLRNEWLKLYQAHGGEVDAGERFQASLGEVVEPCRVKNQIERVDFLDGPRKTVLTADSRQHVNLPREPKFADVLGVSLDRLGPMLRVRVKFRRPKVERFKVALLAHRENATYTPEEQQRRPEYECTRSPAALRHVWGDFDHHQGAAPIFTGKTRKDGTAVIDGAFRVPAAGGDRYRLVAWDVNGVVVASEYEVTTTRTLFYATFLADDPNRVRLDQDWFRRELEATYRRHHIDLVWLGEKYLPGIVYHDIDLSERLGDAVMDVARSAPSAAGPPYAAFSPYLLMFAFVDHCAKTALKPFEPVTKEGVSPADVIDVPLFRHPEADRNKDPEADWRRCLWKGLGQPLIPSDRTGTGHEWFKSATLTARTSDGKVHEVSLAATDFTLVARSVEAPGAIVQLKLRVPESVPAKANVTVRLEAVYMVKAVLGQSLTGKHAGITVQPSRRMFEAIPDAKQLSSTIHEFGHAIGMVATPEKQGLAHGHQYDWNGSHCWHGIAGPATSPEGYHEKPRKDTGDCVMYGLIPERAPNLAFCPDCAAVLRKLDLGGGFSG